MMPVTQNASPGPPSVMSAETTTFCDPISTDASGYELPDVDEVALLEEIDQVPLRTDHKCPELVVPKEPSTLLKVSAIILFALEYALAAAPAIDESIGIVY